MSSDALHSYRWPVRLHNIWVTVSPRSLHPGTGTDSDRVTRPTIYWREYAPSLANVVSTTPVRPPGTLCHLTYMTLLTLTYSRDDLKLFCLIVCTDLLLLSYHTPRRFVEWRLTNVSLYLYFMGTLKLHSNGPLYSNMVIGTLAINGWAVTFGTARKGLGGLGATSYYLMWHSELWRVNAHQQDDI